MGAAAAREGQTGRAAHEEGDVGGRQLQQKQQDGLTAGRDTTISI